MNEWMVIRLFTTTKHYTLPLLRHFRQQFDPFSSTNLNKTRQNEWDREWRRVDVSESETVRCRDRLYSMLCTVLSSSFSLLLSPFKLLPLSFLHYLCPFVPSSRKGETEKGRSLIFLPSSSFFCHLNSFSHAGRWSFNVSSFRLTHLIITLFILIILISLRYWRGVHSNIRRRRRISRSLRKCNDQCGRTI